MEKRRSSLRYIGGSLAIHLLILLLCVMLPEPKIGELALNHLSEPPPASEQKVAFLSLSNYQGPQTPSQKSTPQPPAPQPQITQQQQSAAAEPPPPIKEELTPSIPEKVTTEARMPEFGKKAAQKKVEKNKKFRRQVTPEELKQLARLAVVKEKVVKHQQAQTRTDFFRHAAFIATQPSPSGSGPAGNISGLGDLKEHSYKMRVRDALLNAYNAVKYKIERPAGYADSGVARLHCVINKDGSISELAIIMSSGDPNFDHLILESIRNVAPFPAIPDHLGIDKFVIGGITIS